MIRCLREDDPSAIVMTCQSWPLMSPASEVVGARHDRFGPKVVAVSHIDSFGPKLSMWLTATVLPADLALCQQCASADDSDARRQARKRARPRLRARETRVRRPAAFEHTSYSSYSTRIWILVAARSTGDPARSIRPCRTPAAQQQSFLLRSTSPARGNLLGVGRGGDCVLVVGRASLRRTKSK